MKTSLIPAMITLSVVLAAACGPAQTPTAAPPTIAPTPTAAPPTTAPTQAFTLATSIKDVVGTWYNEGAGVYLRFYDDGTLHNADSPETLDTQPYATSEIRFEGTQMSLKETSVADVPSCGDALGLYEVRLLPEGRIQIVTIEDLCPPRAGDTALVFEPARPTDPIAIMQASNQRLNAGDVDGFMKFFAEDAVMSDPYGRYAGLQAIRENMQEIVDNGMTFELSDLSVDGNVVTYSSKATIGRRDLGTSKGLDVIKNGLIIFEGTEEVFRFECDKDPSQAFCPHN